MTRPTMRFLIRRLGPWGWVLMGLQAVLTTRRHLQRTAPEDRARVQELLRRSGGRPSRNLTAAERRELAQAARRLRPGKLARDLGVGVVRPGRAARRLGRRR
jgi:hypothetical protein